MADGEEVGGGEVKDKVGQGLRTESAPGAMAGGRQTTRKGSPRKRGKIQIRLLSLSILRATLFLLAAIAAADMQDYT